MTSVTRSPCRPTGAGKQALECDGERCGGPWKRWKETDRKAVRVKFILKNILMCTIHDDNQKKGGGGGNIAVITSTLCGGLWRGGERPKGGCRPIFHRRGRGIQLGVHSTTFSWHNDWGRGKERKKPYRENVRLLRRGTLYGRRGDHG